jgi:Kef-type K+ transport system membrane component KefB
MENILGILVILVAARLFGEISERAGQPSIIGQILAGVLLGPFVFNLLQPNSNIESLALLGEFFLMFLAGMKIDLKSLVSTTRNATFAAFGGLAFPMAFGLGLGLFVGPAIIPGFSGLEALVLGICLSITAVSVSVDILDELGLLRTRLGESIIEAGFMDNIMALVMLAIVTSYAGMSNTSMFFSVSGLFLNLILFFSIFTFIGLYIFPRFLSFSEKLRGPEPLFAMAALITIFYAFFSEQMVGSGVVGAFMAGLFARHAMENHPKIEKSLMDNFSAVALGLLTPIFFVWIGLHISPEIFTNPGLFYFSLIVIVTATIGKVGGAGLGSRLSGLKWKQSIGIGIGMNGRGAVELVIAGVALRGALISTELFSVIAFMALVTTLMTPVLMELVAKKLR